MGVGSSGVVTTVVTGMPIGIGEPCFDKLEAGFLFEALALSAGLQRPA